jgi:hypothetical protein
MGLRGPIRRIDSQRGKREKIKYAGAVCPPDPPAWLTPEETAIFRDLIERAVEANTPLERLDSESYAVMSRLLQKIRVEKDDYKLANLIRALHPYMQSAGITPVQRARMQGLKKRAETDPLEAALCA